MKPNEDIRREFDRIDTTPVANPRYEGKTVLEVVRLLFKTKHKTKYASSQGSGS